jgi:NADH-quinone oxidoreductase subunit C
MLDAEKIVADLKSQFGEENIWDIAEPFGMLTLTTKRENIREVITYLRDHKEFRFIFQTDLCGVHYPENSGNEFAVVYHLHSLETNTRMRVKVFAPAEDPSVPTVSDIHLSANWQERETYDFFGIIFTGHPDLRRILNMDEMDYFPMRKEYPLEDQGRRDKVDEMFGR